MSSTTPRDDSTLAQILQLDEFRLFYQPPNDNNFYHVTCEILKDFHSVSLDEDNYDYEFFFNNYHIKCKLLSHYSIVSVLNKEIYGMDFDANELKRKYLLTSLQKLNLERNLKQVLPFYLYIPEVSGSIINYRNIEHNMTQPTSIVVSQCIAPTTTEMVPATATATTTAATTEFHTDSNDYTHQVTPQQ
ncbi:hypothetical protein C1645_754275 [Glomus cerebriforme]|uniref:Uncharacterized protein n=1 Tax=Glomus cerebriforme TaxID=658196 RepID=A0A397TEZ7_9GLOM|nr:hypothetical protein C1645_754275 [Glomus cerebriforme]